MASQLWRALSPEHKSRYEAMFKVDQARYRREKVSSATAPAVGFSMPATSPSLPPADPAPAGRQAALAVVVLFILGRGTGSAR